MDGLSVVLPNTLAAPRSAREALDGLFVPVQNGLRAKLGLLVSELVLSALKLEAQSIHLDVAQSAHGLRVEVRNREGPSSTSARGEGASEGRWAVFLVRRLADRWGGDRHGMWFELDLPEAPERSEHGAIAAAAV